MTNSIFCMTRTAIGVTKQFNSQNARLDNSLALRFDINNKYAFGYYQILVRLFEEFAKKRNESFLSLNICIHLAGNELSEFLVCVKNAEKICDSRYPETWEEFVGTSRINNSSEREMKPMLSKSMLTNILNRLRKLVVFAIEKDRKLVFCNGMMYMIYFDTKLSKGKEYT